MNEGVKKEDGASKGEMNDIMVEIIKKHNWVNNTQNNTATQFSPKIIQRTKKTRFV